MDPTYIEIFDCDGPQKPRKPSTVKDISLDAFDYQSVKRTASVTNKVNRLSTEEFIRSILGDEQIVASVTPTETSTVVDFEKDAWDEFVKSIGAIPTEVSEPIIEVKACDCACDACKEDRCEDCSLNPKCTNYMATHKAASSTMTKLQKLNKHKTALRPKVRGLVESLKASDCAREFAESSDLKESSCARLLHHMAEYVAGACVQ